MEFIAILLLTYPAFVLGLLIRLGLLFRWKFPHYVWYIPLILCGIGSCAFEKSLEMGIFCIVAIYGCYFFDWLFTHFYLNKLKAPEMAKELLNLNPNHSPVLKVKVLSDSSTAVISPGKQ